MRFLKFSFIWSMFFFSSPFFIWFAWIWSVFGVVLPLRSPLLLPMNFFHHKYNTNLPIFYLFIGMSGWVLLFSLVLVLKWYIPRGRESQRNKKWFFIFINHAYCIRREICANKICLADAQQAKGKQRRGKKTSNKNDENKQINKRWAWAH